MCWLFCVSVLFFTFATSDSKLLDKLSKIKWNCADENCSVPISEGYGLRLYNGDDPLKLNFNINDQFLILGKSNDKLDNYWLVQAGDRKGIVPVQFIKERKIFINKANQVVTELNLSSIIQPIETGRTIKEAIKPSSPNLVIDGTTLPPSYEDDSSSSEVIVEDDIGEVYEPPKPQVKENPVFGASSHIKNDSPETDNNQKANYTESSEGFAGGQVVSPVSDNINETSNSQHFIENSKIENSTNEKNNGTETSNSQSFIENSKIENSTNEKNNGTEGSQDFASGETVHVGSISGDSNDQNFIVNGEINHNVNDTETNQVLASDIKVESTVNNFTDTSNNKTEESDEKKKADDLKGEKNDPENELTKTQNVNTFNEPHTTIVPQQSNEKYSTNADQLPASEKENSTAAESVLNTDSYVTLPPTVNTDAYVTLPPTEIPKSELPVSSDVEDIKEDLAVPPEIGGEIVPAEPNLLTGSETVKSSKEEATIPQLEPGLEIEMNSPSPETDLPSDSQQGKEDMIVPPSVTSNLHDPFSHPKGSLPSYAQSVGNDKPSESEILSPMELTPIQHTPLENIKPAISEEFSPTSIPFSSMPVSDPILQYSSPDISNSYASSNNDFNNNDTDNSELLPNESPLTPEQEEPISSVGGDMAGSVSEPPIIDQHLIDQPYLEEMVTETLPSDNSVTEGNDREDNSAFMSQTDELADVIQEGDGWFSGISSVMSSFTEMFTKSDIGVDKDVSTASEEVVTSSEKSSQRSDDEVKHCAKESCGQQWKDDTVDNNESIVSAYLLAMLGSFSESQMSFSTFLCMVITSVVVLLFSLGYYYLQNLKQDTSLVAKINTVSTELFFAQKELASIEEQYHLANENYRRLVSETSHNETAIEELRKELEESKAARGVLEDEIKRLEKEIESLVEEGDEMHRMLSESFSEEERTKSLLANISDLKSVLSDRLQEIVSLTEQLDKEKQEVELLTISLKKSEEKREATEDKLTKVLIDADSKTFAVTKEFEEKITTLERIIEERSLERTNFEKQLCELKGTCESLMVEKELAEKELKKAHGVNSGKALSEWLEVKNIRTDLLTVQKEAEKLSEALEEAKNRGALLEDKEKQLLNEIKDLNNKYESAEKDKIEALTKLQVLSNYFKEKEIQLQEELGIKESQWLQKQSEDHTIYEQMRSLREENLSYKAQNDALKKEIIDQEASFKIQIANEEQKAQENWINLRHTERRLKEVQMEAAHLRSRLTALEVNPDSLEDKHKSLEMVNGDVSMGAASPPFMLYPPPDYIPPPPLVSPTRPPPLGRLSSPPLTPPAPLSPFEFYPPPPPSPPPPLRVHKPQPREPHRKQKDSQSSNHSSESTEKPIRRGKR